ncbi:death on curing protein [Quadrisphaera granulorum]|uniref:Death-on-curing protein n=1 Tax=Quadrisphaera granulorum TaxID=317664 RepID=A0A316AD10_9ACTN|nr:type II toxin-antitoxin system death-on-curing family toxin [Quadrisphaera granulorum]PWJ55521.1 death-on-curing protein [Quadrisphaera granulorum]SZE95585.1 death on curing protein [Quadrisphaera granulorum]
MDYLTTEDLLEIATGVIDDVQVRDLGLLASAAARPQTTVFGRDAYPDLADKVAALLHSLARNHPLVDGNKRLAWSAARVMCLLNGADLAMPVDDAERMVLAVAAGEMDAAELSVIVRRHLR